jgi:hypothetical protein
MAVDVRPSKLTVCNASEHRAKVFAWSRQPLGTSVTMQLLASVAQGTLTPASATVFQDSQLHLNSISQ